MIQWSVGINIQNIIQENVTDRQGVNMWCGHAHQVCDFSVKNTAF